MRVQVHHSHIREGELPLPNRVVTASSASLWSSTIMMAGLGEEYRFRIHTTDVYNLKQQRDARRAVDPLSTMPPGR